MQYFLGQLPVSWNLFNTSCNKSGDPEVAQDPFLELDYTKISGVNPMAHAKSPIIQYTVQHK